MTEAINGVSFDEYAAACGNMGQGMSETEVLKVLGLEKPVWDDTLNKWNKRFGELLGQDMNLASHYAEIYSNPRVGRFAGVATPAADISALLKIVPDLNTYLKISIHQSVGNKYGFDPVTVLAGYGIDIGKWGSLNTHYLKEQNKLLDYQAPDSQQRYEYFTAIHQHWNEFFEQQYAQSKVDLARDIQF